MVEFTDFEDDDNNGLFVVRPPFDLQTAVKTAIKNADKEDVTPSPTVFPTPLELRARIGYNRLALELPEQKAEGYALLGDYEKAVELAPDNPEYRTILEAINRPDGEVCSCPKIIGQGANRIETMFVKDRFIRHGAEKELWSCSLCGFQNVK